MSLQTRIERLEAATATDDAPALIVGYCPPGHAGRYDVAGEVLTGEQFTARFPDFRGKLVTYKGNTDPCALL